MRSRVSGQGLGAVAFAVGLVPAVTRADEPIVQRQTWTGHVDFFATGAPLAVDGPDGDTSVDMLAQPASVEVAPPDVPAGAELLGAFLYWGGSIENSECANATLIDDEVVLTPPGGAPLAITGDECFCSVAGSMAYDVQLCRTDVTAQVPMLEGTYEVDEFAALIDNQTTNNASFSIVVVYSAPQLNPRRVALYDGLLTMSSDTNAEQIIALGGLDVDEPPVGDLTWYVLEGDVGGSSGEGVEVTGIPGGAVLPLSDAINPVGNPMNHTINTTMPVQPDSYGVDVDQFSIDAALASTDTAVEVRYTAGVDKWWLAYDIVGVNVFEPVLYAGSAKTWVLHDDADGNGLASPGDTIRYTLHLENSGNADGTVLLTDPIPAEAASWTLVDAGGGSDISVGDTMAVADVPLAEGDTVDVVVDVVIADVPDGTEMLNVATYVAQPGGVEGELVALPVVIGEPGAGDTTGGGESDGTADGTSGTSSTGDGGTGSGSGVASETGVVGTTGTVDPMTGGGTSVGLTGGDAEPSGCGCGSRTDPSGGWWALVLGLGAARRRRPRRS